ncbi:MAG TPA: T9SS type A sorting domain-containing protein, partial [Rhodothermales bacterium]|nr:T9SS type A sorting domain-containing protein [Rhodothermales bacterium]
ETSILEAIYPNPATIRTNIRFYVQETGLTDLTLYDAQGRRVAWIANDIRFGRTWYEEPVLLSGLPNGTYFLVLTTHSGKNEPTHKTQPLIVAR